MPPSCFIPHSLDASKMEDASQYAKMKVADLKKELKAKGLAVTGNKNELVERLLAAEGVDPVDPVEGDDEEFDEEEILGGEMDTTITPQEEAAALSGANLKEKKGGKTPAKTPAKKAEKAPVKKAEPKKTNASPTKTEQENIEPPKKVLKVDDDEEDSGEKSAFEKRAERFGLPMTDEAKKAARSGRFGEMTNGTVKASTKLDKTPVTVSIDKLKARAERFGEITSKSLTKADELEKKKTREERFGTEEEKKASESDTKVDAAKAARAARFAAEKTKAKDVDVEVETKAKDVEEGTVKAKAKVEITA